MVNEDFSKIMNCYIDRISLNKSIEAMEKQLNDLKLLGKYRCIVNNDGVTIKRDGKFDIIPTEELRCIEKETGTQLLLVNEKYYMFAWEFHITKINKKKERL